MNRFPCASRGGADDSFVAYCLVAPFLLVHMGTGNASDVSFMAELLQCFLYIPRHREVYLSLLVIPIEGYTDILSSGPGAC